MSAIGSPTLPAEPFRGLEPFRFADAEILFARADEVRELVRSITIHRAVMLYGESGAGKSSLVNAGLLPAVLAAGFRPDRIRVQPRAGEELVVERVRIDDAGTEYLPSSFSDATRDAPSQVVLGVEAFVQRLDALSGEPLPLLVFDQFEELVTLFDGSPAGRALQAQICDMLVELIRQPERQVKVLLVFREDYLAQLSTLLARCPALPEHGERLLAPPIEALPTILRGPFERHPEAYPARITPELAAQLQAEIELRSDGSRLNLSEIEIACLRLWRDPDPSALYASKRFDGLLADTLADVLESFTATQRDAAVALLGRMVTASGTRNVVSEDDLLEDVLTNDGVSNDEAREVLGRLESERIIRREARHRIYCYEIVSEFLVGSIVQRRIAREAARAEAVRREEAERQLDVARQHSRRQRFTIGALALGVLLLVALAVYAFQQKREASRALHRQQIANVGLLAERSELTRNPTQRLREAIAAANGLHAAGLDQSRDLRQRVLLSLRDALGASHVIALLPSAAGPGVIARIRSNEPGWAAPAIDDGTLRDPSGRLRLRVDRDRARVALIAADGVAHVLHPFSGQLSSVALSPTGAVFATGSSDGSTQVWSASDASLRATLVGGTTRVEHVSFSRDGRWLVAGGDDGVTRIWDVRSSRQLSTLGPAGPVTFAAFADADRQVVTRGSDGRVRRWQSGRAESVAIACGGAVVALALGSTHDAVAACADGRVHVVGARGGPVPPIVTPGAFRTAAISIPGRVVAGIGADGRLSLVGLQDNSVVNLPGKWASVGVRTGGDTLDLLARDGTGERLVLASRKPSHRVKLAPAGSTAAFDPTGHVALTLHGNTARIVVRSNGTLVRALPVGEVGKIARAVFSPRGNRVVTLGSTQPRLWSARGRWIARLGDRPASSLDTVNAAAFSPDGHLLITGTRGGTIALWEAGNGSRIGELLGEAGVDALAADPALDTVAAAGIDGRVRLFPCTACGSYGQVLAVARSRLALLTRPVP